MAKDSSQKVYKHSMAEAKAEAERLGVSWRTVYRRWEREERAANPVEVIDVTDTSTCDQDDNASGSGVSTAVLSAHLHNALSVVERQDAQIARLEARIDRLLDLVCRVVPAVPDGG